VTKKTNPGLGKWPSRGEGWWRIYNSLKDRNGDRGNILDSINYVEQKLVFRTIEAGTGLKIEILDADGFPSSETPFTYLRLSSTITEGVNIKINGTPVGSGPATTLNFTGSVSAVQTSPGEISISFTGTGGSGVSDPFNEIIPYNYVYSGALIVSGQTTVSGFFNGQLPAASDVIININGLTLEYDTNAAISDFQIVGSNLILNVNNIGYPIDNNDRITGYYWHNT
jgi:hypothetical protein